MNHYSDDFFQHLRALKDPTDYFTQGEIADWSRFPNKILIFSRRTRTHFHGGPTQIFHHHLCVVFIALNGGGILRVDGTDLHLGTGEAMLIFPFQSHFCHSMEKTQVDWLIITFNLVNLAHWSALKSLPVTLTDRAHGLIEALVLSRFDKSAGQDVPELIPSIQCYYLLAEMLKRAPAPPVATKKDDELTSIYAQVNNYALLHVKSRFTIEQMAKALGYSKVHLQRHFRQEHGTSIGRFLQQMRLRWASTLLRSGKTPISEIAQQCGFESVFTFSRAFKQSIGMSPRAYRTNAKNNPTDGKFTHPIEYPQHTEDIDDED